LDVAALSDSFNVLLHEKFDNAAPVSEGSEAHTACSVDRPPHITAILIFLDIPHHSIVVRVNQDSRRIGRLHLVHERH
jgi:hypothetical protein